MTDYRILQARIKACKAVESRIANRKYTDLKQRIEYTMDTVTKVSEELAQETRANRRLRRAIMALHGEDYWKIIQKAERGYYELLSEEGAK